MIKLRCIGPNQTELQIGGATFLFSYGTPVAYHRPGGGYFRTEQKFSPTTTRHINNWLKGVNAKVVPQEEIEKLLQGKG